MQLIWTTRYSVGIDEIDAQHQRIIKMIGLLREALPKSHPEQELREVILGIAEYARVHFAFEEHLLDIAGYPELEIQKAEHRKLVADLHDILIKLKRGGNVTVRQLLGWLTNWWVRHIESEDLKYGRWILGQKNAGRLPDLTTVLRTHQSV